MVTTRPPKTIVEPTALGTVANTDSKLLIYRLFQKGRVLAQDARVGHFVFTALRVIVNRFSQFGTPPVVYAGASARNRSVLLV